MILWYSFVVPSPPPLGGNCHFVTVPPHHGGELSRYWWGDYKGGVRYHLLSLIQSFVEVHVVGYISYISHLPVHTTAWIRGAGALGSAAVVLGLFIILHRTFANLFLVLLALLLPAPSAVYILWS